MKQKNTLILYNNQKDLMSLSRKEAVFAFVQRQMIQEGREVERIQNDTRGKTVTFNDGSKLMLFSFGISLSGYRLTHLYIDQESLTMPNSDIYIERCVTPFVLNHNPEHAEYMDTAESPEKRIQIYRADVKNGFSFKVFGS